MSNQPTTENNDDVVYTDCPEVSCEGNGPATGHPLIYLNMGSKDAVECPYCSRRFIRHLKS